MKIISLEASNILRLEAIQIQCDGKNVTLSGANTTGKTSVLKCISMALGGKDEIPDEPIHRGAKKGKIDLDLGEFKIRRTFTEGGGGTLTVSAKDGEKYPSPQSVLDGLVGQLTFDPLAFTRLDDKKQSEVLRNLVGLDFSEIDREAKEVFERRTVLNREINQKESAVQTLPHYADVPAEEVSVEDIVKRLRVAEEHNRKSDVLMVQSNQAETSHKGFVQHRDSVQKRIVQLQKELDEARNDLAQAEENVAAADDAAQRASDAFDAFRPMPVDDFLGQIANVQETNRKVRANSMREANAVQARALVKQADGLTDALDKLASEKKELLESAKMPVPGLSFTDAGILYKGLPFNQASAAEQLRVSAAMGMALNPKLRVLMIRDASLLDEISLQILNDLATQEDFQLWMEVVSAGKEVSVVIEEGKTK